jgi:hypothetical protein
MALALSQTVFKLRPTPERSRGYDLTASLPSSMKAATSGREDCFVY